MAWRDIEDGWPWSLRTNVLTYGAPFLGELGEAEAAGLKNLYLHANATGYNYDGKQIIDQNLRNARPPGSILSPRRVYWLPWLNESSQHVSWDDLDKAQYFMTSQFSGCRFVANQWGLQHVAHWASADLPAGFSHTLRSLVRDQVEQNMDGQASAMGVVARPFHRRTLTMTVDSGIDSATRVNYDGNRDFVNVIGRRMRDRFGEFRWYIYAQTVNALNPRQISAVNELT